MQELQGDDALFRLRAYEAAALALRRLGESKPVVLVLDDLHWADEGSLEFIEHLMSRHRELPLLCLVLTRQTLFEQHAGWAAGDARHTRLDLKPLDGGSSRELAETLLQRIDRRARDAARAAHRRRRGQPVLHGRTGARC